MSRNLSLGLLFMTILVVSLSCEESDDGLGNSFGDEYLENRAVTIVETYQAEDSTSQSGCNEMSNHDGYTGRGFMDYGGNGSLVKWNNINAPSAGQYTLDFRYANGSGGNRQCAITVNGTTNVGDVTFGKTGSWTTWGSASIKVTLTQGDNEILVKANTRSGGPNLDKMDLVSEGDPGGGTDRCALASEGKSATLSCPNGQVIDAITFASYGKPTGSCPNFSAGSCHASTSKSKVESLCLDKQSCSVGAKNGVFGDPCRGTVKKLAVAYTCRNVVAASECAQVPEGGTAKLSCPNGQVIDAITFASYGKPTGSCPSFVKGTCHSSNSESKVESLCLNKPSCNVGANNGTFGDPCPGTYKKLAIAYSCNTDGTDTDTDVDTDADTDADTDNSVAPGVHNTVMTSIPGDEPTACEWDWTVRMLRHMPTAIVPRRMYFSSCKTGSASPEMFTSLTVGHNAQHPQRDPTSGAIVRSRYIASTGKFEVVDEQHFPECLEMHGIATSADCSTVAALCRIPSGTSGADKDSLATHPKADWMTQPYICGDNKKNDEMWLYEWTNGDITAKSKRYIVHKAIGSYEYGNNYLRYGENDNTYGIAVKTTVGNGSCHEADAFLVLDRTDYDMTTRAWSWACGTGHTIFNRPAYDPTTKKYAMMCSTDYNQAQQGGMGAYFFRMEDGAAQEFHHLNLSGMRTKGGASTLLPRPGGGFLGVLVGVDGQIEAGVGYPLEPPTGIGLVKFDAGGNQIGEINWVLKDADTYLSYSQIAHLGDNRYLLGWGVMKKINDPTDTTDESYRIPWEYYLMEIDQDGRRLTEPLLLEGTGWGEQDQMIPLGNGRVAWTYIENPALTGNGSYPSCNADKLQFSVYVSPN